MASNAGVARYAQSTQPVIDMLTAANELWTRASEIGHTDYPEAQRLMKQARDTYRDARGRLAKIRAPLAATATSAALKTAVEDYCRAAERAHTALVEHDAAELDRAASMYEKASDTTEKAARLLNAAV